VVDADTPSAERRALQYLPGGKIMSKTKTPRRAGIGSSNLFDSLLRRKDEIEYLLCDTEDARAHKEWLKRPNRNGWWLWLEGGRGCRTELLLVVGKGMCIAEDDEWERATGKPAEHDGWVENYWEGTETTQSMMPGLWFFLSNAELSSGGARDQ
jgi:hypothetical protein